MRVDFNNVRKQACFSYDRLAKKLNKNIDTEKEEINIDVEEIQEEMDNLRSLIMTIACIYKEGDADFVDLSEDVDPIAWFNENNE